MNSEMIRDQFQIQNWTVINSELRRRFKIWCWFKIQKKINSGLGFEMEQLLNHNSEASSGRFRILNIWKVSWTKVVIEFLTVVVRYFDYQFIMSN